MQIVLDELGLVFIAIVGGFLLFGLHDRWYKLGYNSGYTVGSNEARQDNESVQGALDKSRETVEKQKSKIKDLEGQLSEKTKQLQQLEVSKKQEIDEAIKTRRAELDQAMEAKRVGLQIEYDLARQALEPKLRAEAEAEWKPKFEKQRNEFIEKIRSFISIVMEDNEELIRLFNISPRFDTLAVLMKAKGDKGLLADLRAAAQLGEDHFKKMVETKHQAVAQGKGTEGPLGSIDAQILALLKKQALSHGQITQVTGKPKATVSDAIKRLRIGGMVEQDPDSGMYYAL